MLHAIADTKLPVDAIAGVVPISCQKVREESMKAEQGSPLPKGEKELLVGGVTRGGKRDYRMRSRNV